MSARTSGVTAWRRRAGLVFLGTGIWLTLVSVGTWAAARVLPQGVLPALAKALLALIAELALHAWPLLLVALGAALLLQGTTRPRAAAGSEGER